MPFAVGQEVTLARDLPDEALRAGLLVAIRLVYDGGAAYEVVVMDDRGKALYIGMLPHEALEGEEAPPAPPRDFFAERPELLRRLGEEGDEWDRFKARADYIDLLPVAKLSRCPVSGEALERAIDTVELDGPWWNYRDPARPASDWMPTLVAVTGAVALHHVPYTPFLVVPGPERPFVAPRLLACDGVTAVVSSLAIGAHTGYPIAYFAPPLGPPPSVGRLNDWGASTYLLYGPDDVEERKDYPHEREWDYDLAPWIERGKLLWIAPHDDSLTLRSSVSDCPYLDLLGHRGITRMQEGKVWWPKDFD